MNDLVFTGKITINEFCSRKNYSRSECNLCLKACQFDGLKIENDNAIKVINCIGCGICFNACPNNAIALYKNTDLDIIKSVVEPIFGCIFADGENKVSCVSRLNENLMIFFVLKFGNLVIYKGDCQNCKFKPTLSLFDSALKKANQILEAMQKPFNVEIIAKPLPNAFEPNFGVLRRELFKIKENTTKRAFLVDLIRERIKKDTVFDGIINLNIGDSCDFCGICENVCPKGALIIEKQETAAIYFNPSLCSACETCIEACSQKAITKSPAFVSDLIPKALKLIEKPKKICSCGSIYYTDKDSCPECKLKEKKRDQLFEYIKDLF